MHETLPPVGLGLRSLDARAARLHSAALRPGARRARGPRLDRDLSQRRAKHRGAERLGPRPYRLRGGGPYSVRGVQAGTLGRTRPGREHAAFPAAPRAGSAASSCACRSATASASPPSSTSATSTAARHRKPPSFASTSPNTTLGAGLRYKTLVGPLRLDVGMAGARPAGQPRGSSASVDRSDPLFKLNGAVQLTIGEAF